MSHPPIRIVFPLFPMVTQLDFAGPAQLLSRLPGAQLVVAAASRAPVISDCGFAIVPTHDFADSPPADILCVPGGQGVADALGDAATVAFIARQAGRARWVTSVCTGAFLLGAAGLLKGRRATTHWGYTQLLPLVGAIPVAARVVEDGHVITAGGVTSGIDFALTLAAREAGDTVARRIQLALEYDPAPPFAGGNVASSPPDMVTALRTHVYDAPAARMAAALPALPPHEATD